jgi:hypothetical protein
MSVTARQSHGSPWRSKRVRDNIIMLTFGEQRSPWPTPEVAKFLAASQTQERKGKGIWIGLNETKP